MRIAIGNDHVGLSLKPAVLAELQRLGQEVVNEGTDNVDRTDFPDYAEKVGRRIQSGEADRGILICGSGIGMTMAANKLRRIRACVAHDSYSARQGVEHDEMNVLCLGSQVIGNAVAAEVVRAFIEAEFNQIPRYAARVDKITALETS
jgi:ribose 5-phosphate isomerase B